MGALGVKQAICHRSRDAALAGKGWTKEDLVKMKALEDIIGLELSITDGNQPNQII